MKKSLFILLTALFSTAFITACEDLDYEPDDSQEASAIQVKKTKGIRRESLKLQHVESGRCIGFKAVAGAPAGAEVEVGTRAKYVNCNEAPEFFYRDGFQLVLEDDFWPKCLDSQAGPENTHHVRLQYCADPDDSDSNHFWRLEYQEWYFVKVLGKINTYRIMNTAYSAHNETFIDDMGYWLEMDYNNPTCGGNNHGCQDFKNLTPEFFGPM